MKKTILSIIALVFCVMVNAQTITDACVYESFRVKATVIDIKKLCISTVRIGISHPERRYDCYKFCDL